MNPAIPILALFGGVLAWTLIKTARAAVNLNYTMLGFGIYRVSSDGVALRLKMRFTNAQNTTLTVNLIDLAAYLNSSTTYDSNGNLVVNSRGDLLSSYADSTGFLIAANGFTEKQFIFNLRWADLGRVLLGNAAAIINAISNQEGMNSIISSIIGHNILIYGIVKAEGVSVNICNVIPITDERNS